MWISTHPGTEGTSLGTGGQDPKAFSLAASRILQGFHAVEIAKQMMEKAHILYGESFKTMLALSNNNKIKVKVRTYMEKSWYLLCILLQLTHQPSQQYRRSNGDPTASL
jgi:hypothetical protein